jgi:hypothetical protein
VKLIRKKKKADHVLKQNYRDDDIEELDEQLIESLVSLLRRIFGAD